MRKKERSYKKWNRAIEWKYKKKNKRKQRK